MIRILAALFFLTVLVWRLRRDRREWLEPAPEEWPDEWLGW